MKINGQEITAEKFAFDGCHKIYLLADEDEQVAAMECHYNILPIEDLQAVYETACPLRFISYWNLSKAPIVRQFEDAIFEPVGRL